MNRKSSSPSLRSSTDELDWIDLADVMESTFGFPVVSPNAESVPQEKQEETNESQSSSSAITGQEIQPTATFANKSILPWIHFFVTGGIFTLMIVAFADIYHMFRFKEKLFIRYITSGRFEFFSCGIVLLGLYLAILWGLLVSYVEILEAEELSRNRLLYKTHRYFLQTYCGLRPYMTYAH
ncbi:hypothetical protein SPOG_02320 [Schizosaccharomyces cryophilus OY26]|uniref:Uncharacterized protein n=1 Tax=Schizosaccharomyces cryophilus (strain OY26 / ATCC MYA-4695 / CBS 11777 / NBRC 106824 / NRRL Y48691) TaxID=653667 RepID=S9VTE0_SCHCR|nr:uncharacterized protein SPOG_02320 [Schizosaccharomyces cryophilus OY26]EPY51143.1 hypothetical protein SPOG_02320 [Schizosaccharomyces cryophilus OY26]